MFQILECSQPECRFRFPVEAGDEQAQRCPRCSAPVTVVTLPYAHDVAWSKANPPRPLRALLDNIRSIHNVGSIFRSADGAGVHHLYLCGITATPHHPKLAKAALGAHTTVPWSYHRNGLETAVLLRAAGHPLYALETTAAATPLFKSSWPAAPAAPPILIVGNEKAGIDPGLLDLCDGILTLPMHGMKRSLNAAVAFGIAAYHIAIAA